MAYRLKDLSQNFLKESLMRSRPTDGTARRLTRILHGKYAVSIKQVARMLHISDRHAVRFIDRLVKEGVIELRYRERRYNYYSIRRDK
jgi:predicted ArsR family transcriptional regulator